MRFEKYGNENGQGIMLIHGMATIGHAFESWNVEKRIA